MQLIKRRTIYAFFCIAIALFMLTGCNGAGKRPAMVRNGIADLSTVDFSAESVNLDGQWLFFPDEILSPAEVDRRVSGKSPNDATPAQPVPVTVPGLWRTQEFRGKKGPTFGVGTMVLSMRLPENTPPLTLRIALNQGSSCIYVNGQIAEDGLVTDPRRADLVSAGNPRYIPIPQGTKDVRVVSSRKSTGGTATARVS